MGPWYRVDYPVPRVIKTHPGSSLCAHSRGLKATAQLLEHVLDWQGERNSLATEKIQVCGMLWGWNRGE